MSLLSDKPSSPGGDEMMPLLACLRPVYGAGMSFGTPDHPFYKPLWRRLAIIAVTAVWAGLEFFRGGEPLWMVLSGGAFAYSLWTFLITWKDPPPAA